MSAWTSDVHDVIKIALPVPFLCDSIIWGQHKIIFCLKNPRPVKFRMGILYTFYQ